MSCGVERLWDGDKLGGGMRDGEVRRGLDLGGENQNGGNNHHDQ